MISMCACGGVNCPHCNPNLWTNAGLTPPANTFGENPLQAENERLKARIDALEKEVSRVREQTICETTGFLFSYCCRAIDTGVDIRKLEIPMVLEKVLAALLEGSDEC